MTKNIMILIFAAAFLTACGKEREHKPLPKIEVMAKSSIQTDQEYLYVASSGQVSRSTSLARPYYQGQEKIVTLSFEENDLVAYTVDKETQFEDNKTNKKVVFRIPIEHLEYREREDAFGEGTNQEELNNYVHWSQRKFFKARAEQFEFTSTSTLPTEFGKIFGSDRCNKQTGQSELEFSVNEGAIDIVIKKDYTSNYFCEQNIDEIIDLTWSQETHFSLVPLNKLASPNYKVKEYPREWERTFGFFDTTDKRLDSSNTTTQSKEKYLMHRWNPERGEILYHLDPAFNKPENKILKLATLKGVERLNEALEESGSKLKITTKDGDQNFRPGHVSYSSIVMVEDPVGAGLLGYGPSVVNPRTGEIVQARTVMYPGIMKKIIRRAYDELIEIENNTNIPAQLADQNEAVIAQLQRFSQGNDTINMHQWHDHKGEMEHLKAESGTPQSASSQVQAGSIFNKPVSEKSVALKEESFFERTKKSVRGLFVELLGDGKEDQFNLNQVDLIEAYSRHNMMPAKLETFTDITDKVLKDKILNIGQKKDWDDLAEETRKEIIDLVMPYVWIPTLIHEVGHNLGLRHNFAGSEDKDNFYTIEELAEKGVQSEYGSPYSSMMEYSKSEIKGLRVPGKYDVAALRYGYADKVELQDGSIVDVAVDQKSVPENLKEFGFCTDEGVALNANCNRFDEGVGTLEILKSMIDSYEQRYKMSYFRNGRSNFSMFDSVFAASRTNSMFRSMRIVFERLSDIMTDFNLTMDQVKEIEWLNEYNEASKLAADFFMQVIAEPDYSCVIYQGNQFQAIRKFSDLAGFEDKTCYDIQLNPGFSVVGELGKSYLSRRFRDNPNIYLDQIDVRGTWFNKLLAMSYLTKRTLGSYSFDDNTLSYLDHPEIGQKINNFAKDLLIGDVNQKVKVTLLGGAETEITYKHSLGKGYEIPAPVDWRLSRYLGLERKKYDLAEILMDRLHRDQKRGLSSSSSDKFLKSVSVLEALPQDGRGVCAENETGENFDKVGGCYKQAVLGDELYFYGREHEVAEVALQRADLIDNVYALFTRDELIDIYTEMTQPRTPASSADASSEDSGEEGAPASLVEVSDKENAKAKIKAAGVEILLSFLLDELPDSSYYYRILN